MNTLIPILSDLIRFRSDEAEKQNTELITYIGALLTQNQVAFQRLKISSGQENILAFLTPSAKMGQDGGLVLSGHLDTVGVSQDWGTPPFQLTQIGDKLYGRGTVDMKAFSAIVLSLLPFFKKISFPVYLMLSCDEETTAQGIQALLDSLKTQNIKPTYALVGEPTHGAVGISSKGYYGYQTVMTGLAAHSSSPNLGINATYLAAKFISYIEELNTQYAPLGTTLNVGIVQGGQERNSIPDRCQIGWEMRSSFEKTQKEMETCVKKKQESLLQTYPKSKFETQIVEKLPVFEKRGSAFLQKVQSFSQETLELPYATEAGFLQQSGMDVVICGPGDEKLAHTANEYVLKQDLEQYREFLKQFIQSMGR